MSKLSSVTACQLILWLVVSIFTSIPASASVRDSRGGSRNTPIIYQQSTGWIIGKIVSNNGEPLEGLTVGLKDREKVYSTDSGGIFKIESPVGADVFFISYLGKTVSEEKVLVAPNATVDLGTIIIDIASQELEEVKVTDLWRNKFSKKESPHIAKMPLRNLENPQAYTVIPRELLDEQVVTDFNSALRNAPGVAIGPRVDNGRNVFLIRGFEDSGYMRNGLSSPAYMDVDPVNLESIEVIKGPSGTLYGSSLISYGGLINRVTKKPLKYFTGNASLVLGGFNLNRITADLSTPVNKDSTLLFRVNTALTRQGSFQDYGYSKTFMFAPVVSYQINPKTQLVLEAEIYNRNATALPGFTITSTKSGITNVTQVNAIYKRSFSTDQLNMKGGSRTYFGQVNYKFNEHWKSQTSINYSINEYYRLGLRAYILNDTFIRRVGGMLITLRKHLIFNRILPAKYKLVLSNIGFCLALIIYSVIIFYTITSPKEL